MDSDHLLWLLRVLHNERVQFAAIDQNTVENPVSNSVR